MSNTGTLAAGLSFTMKGSGVGDPVTDVQNYVFSGKPNNGTISTPITSGNDALVGNPYPSAILEMEHYDIDGVKFQRKDWRAITILRLFKVASIRALRTKMHSDTLDMFMGGTMSSNDQGPALHTGIIKESEVEERSESYQLEDRQEVVMRRSQSLP